MPWSEYHGNEVTLIIQLIIILLLYKEAIYISIDLLNPLCLKLLINHSDIRTYFKLS